MILKIRPFPPKYHEFKYPFNTSKCTLYTNCYIFVLNEILFEFESRKICIFFTVFLFNDTCRHFFHAVIVQKKSLCVFSSRTDHHARYLASRNHRSKGRRKWIRASHMKTLHVTMAVGFMLIYIQPKLLFFLKDLLQLLIANNNCKGTKDP